MKITTQAEWAALPASFDSYTEIEITGTIREIKSTPKNSFIKVSDSARVDSVYGSARVGCGQRLGDTILACKKLGPSR